MFGFYTLKLQWIKEEDIMRKRVLAGILAVIMAGSIMTGCAGTKKTENKSSGFWRK